jgi:hypothetical protein
MIIPHFRKLLATTYSSVMYVCSGSHLILGSEQQFVTFFRNHSVLKFVNAGMFRNVIQRSGMKGGGDGVVVEDVSESAMNSDD